MSIRLAFLLFCLCAPFTAAWSHPHDAAAACRELVLDYAFYRDRLDADQVAALFTEDAQMTFRDSVFGGRDAIHARVTKAREQNGPSIRHLMSTIHIVQDGDTRAHGVSYVTVYVGNDTVEGFAAIGEYHDEFVLTDGGWRIAKREFKQVFEHQD